MPMDIIPELMLRLSKPHIFLQLPNKSHQHHLLPSQNPLNLPLTPLHLLQPVLPNQNRLLHRPPHLIPSLPPPLCTHHPPSQNQSRDNTVFRQITRGIFPLGG